MFLLPRKNTTIKRKPKNLVCHQVLGRLIVDGDAVDTNYGAFFNNSHLRWPSGKSCWHTDITTGTWDRPFYSDTKYKDTTTAGSTGNTIMEDANADWEVNEWVGDELFNIDTRIVSGVGGLSGEVVGAITSNTKTTITATMLDTQGEGSAVNWVTGDDYIIARDSREKRTDTGMSAAQMATYMDTYNSPGLIYCMNLTMLKDDMLNNRTWENSLTKVQFDELESAIGIERVTHIEVGNEGWAGTLDTPSVTEQEYIAFCKYALGNDTLYPGGFTVEAEVPTLEIRTQSEYTVTNFFDLRTRYPYIKWGAVLFSKTPDNAKKGKWNKAVISEVEPLIDAWIHHTYTAPDTYAELQLSSFKAQLPTSDKEIWITEFGDNRQFTETLEGEQYIKFNTEHEKYSHMTIPYGVVNFSTDDWAFLDYQTGAITTRGQYWLDNI